MMMNLDDQRRKRPGNRDRIDQIKNEMSDETYQPDTPPHTLTAGDTTGDVNDG